MQNCKFYIWKLNLHLIIFDPSVWSFSMHPPMWPQDLGRNVHGGFWKYWFSIYFVPLSALAQSAKICWSWLPQYFLLKRWPKMNVMVKYRNKMKKSCSAYALHKRIIQKLVDNRYAQKCCSAYAFSQKARLNQILNQHANISKSCNEARLSPLPVWASPWTMKMIISYNFIYFQFKCSILWKHQVPSFMDYSRLSRHFHHRQCVQWDEPGEPHQTTHIPAVLQSSISWLPLTWILRMQVVELRGQPLWSFVILGSLRFDGGNFRAHLEVWVEAPAMIGSLAQQVEDFPCRGPIQFQGLLEACQHILTLIATTFCFQTIQKGFDLPHLSGKGMYNQMLLVIIISVAHNCHPHFCEITHAFQVVMDDLFHFIAYCLQPPLHGGRQVHHKAKIQRLHLGEVTENSHRNESRFKTKAISSAPKRESI